jgi:predicted dehydrogenase
MQSKLRILISGPGLIGKVHARIVAAQESCDLAVIVAPSSKENRDFALTAGAAFYTDLGEALDAQPIDGVIISSPNAFHFEQAMICIARGIPTLIEKPLTDQIDEASKLHDAVNRSGVPVLVGHHRTYSPLLNVALEFLRSEKFGRLVAFQGSALFLKPDHYFEDGPWRALKGGGPILINLIHEIGLMREFCGEIAAVQAMGSHDIRKFPVEDTAAIVLQFVNGALGTFLLSDAAASSKSWEMTSGENPAYPHFNQEACYHFAGTNGSLDFPSMRVKSYPTSEVRSWWKPFDETKLEFTSQDPLEAQINNFVEVIRDGAKPRVSAHDGYRNIRVIEAIRQSIETGQKESVVE